VSFVFHTEVYSPFSITTKDLVNIEFIKTYFDPKIRSASGAPFGGIYFGFFSRFIFQAGTVAGRLVTFVINSTIEQKAEGFYSYISFFK
jgi:hypothetical protein